MIVQILAQGLIGQSHGAQAHVADHDAHVEADAGREQFLEAADAALGELGLALGGAGKGGPAVPISEAINAT